MRGLHLVLVKGLDERAGRSGKPVNGRAVERNLHGTLADAAHQSVIRIALLTARELAQRRFDRRPMALLRPASSIAPLATSACNCAVDLSGACRVGCS